MYIVNHNYGRYLSQAINSVLVQDYPLIDIIVIDDASDDDSNLVLSKFESDERIRIFRHESRVGLTACCNSAIRSTCGEYVMRLDADDYLYPSAVRKLVTALHADSAAVLIFPDYLEVDGQGAIIRRVQRHDFSALDVLSDLPAHGACTLTRKSFLLDMGGYDEAIPCQDGLDVWLHVRPQDRVLQIREPLFCYRQHGSNLTRNQRTLIHARTKLFAKHVEKRRVEIPKVLAVVPVRGQVVDPASYPLKLLGGRPLIDWTLEEALSCSSINRVVVSSPDDSVLDYVRNRYAEAIGSYSRSKEHAGLNVNLESTLQDVLRSEREHGRYYDAIMTLTVEHPFRTNIYMQQAINVLQLFDTEGVIGVRHEDELFYQHDGVGLKPVRRDSRLRLERDDLFRACGGFSLHLLPSDRDEDASAVKYRKSRLGHVLLDQLAAFSLRTELDWKIAHYLVDAQKIGETR